MAFLTSSRACGTCGGVAVGRDAMGRNGIGSGSFKAGGGVGVAVSRFGCAALRTNMVEPSGAGGSDCAIG
ncbi:hypothetical protein SDC9_165718 [bioreactor metagenome]|uniref:Uncharacterized protein n=1 Tax=bioreactor metagenome TaxID=1076179 RepID=A0A645FV05_9ZZZZ